MLVNLCMHSPFFHQQIVCSWSLAPLSDHQETDYTPAFPSDNLIASVWSIFMWTLWPGSHMRLYSCTVKGFPGPICDTSIGGFTLHITGSITDESTSYHNQKTAVAYASPLTRTQCILTSMHSKSWFVRQSTSLASIQGPHPASYHLQYE